MYHTGRIHLLANNDKVVEVASLFSWFKIMLTAGISHLNSSSLYEQKMIALGLNHNILGEIEVNFFLILYTIKRGFIFFFLTSKICDNANMDRKQRGE